MVHNVGVVNLWCRGDHVKIPIRWKIKQHTHVGSLFGGNISMWKSDCVAEGFWKKMAMA